MTAFASMLGPRWPLLAFLASAAMLAAAHAFERFGGFEPCSLCLQQREVFWAALALAAATLLVWRVWPRALALRIGAALLALTFLTGAVLAGYHAGVEWKFWPGPSTCSGGGAAGPLSAEAVMAALAETKKVVPCDEAAWRLAGVSMAGYNVLISLALAALSGLAAARAGRMEHAND